MWQSAGLDGSEVSGATRIAEVPISGVNIRVAGNGVSDPPIDIPGTSRHIDYMYLKRLGLLTVTVTVFGFGVHSKAWATGGPCPTSELVERLEFVQPTAGAVVTSPVELELLIGETCICDGGCWLQSFYSVVVVAGEVSAHCWADEPCSIVLDPGPHTLDLLPRINYPAPYDRVDIVVVEAVNEDPLANGTEGEAETDGQDEGRGEGGTEPTMESTGAPEPSSDVGDSATTPAASEGGSRLADQGAGTSDEATESVDPGLSSSGAGCNCAFGSESHPWPWLMLVVLFGLRSGGLPRSRNAGHDSL